jgi:hypothetical protein
MWNGMERLLYGIDGGDRRLTDIVEKDLANAALISASEVADG